MVRNPLKMISDAFLVIVVLAFIFFLYFSDWHLSDKGHIYDFNTNCDIKEFAELQGKRLIVSAFDYDELLILDDDPLASFSTYDMKSIDFIKAYQKEVYLNKLGKFFDLIDISNNTRLLSDLNYRINQAELNKLLIQENNADGALLIINGYGYSQEIGLVEALLKMILPKRIFDVSPGMLMGDPMPERHIIASNMLIFNKNGEIIWNFFGVATINPVKVPEEEETQRTRIFAVCPPGPSDIEIIMKAGIESYVNYIVWLFESDLAGSQKKSYFDDYPDGNKEEHILIFPAVNSPYKVRSATEITNQRSSDLFLFILWDRVLESDWRIPGQWPQALSAGMLFLISLAILKMFSGISKLFLKIIESSPFALYIMGLLWIEALKSGAMFVILVALYFLLKALF